VKTRVFAVSVAWLVCLASSVQAATPTTLIVINQSKKDAVFMVGKGTEYLPLPVAEGKIVSVSLSANKSDRVFVANAAAADDPAKMSSPAKVLAVGYTSFADLTSDPVVVFLEEDGTGKYSLTFWAQKDGKYTLLSSHPETKSKYKEMDVADMVKKAVKGKGEF
jgi:hypothetical protein